MRLSRSAERERSEREALSATAACWAAKIMVGSLSTD